MRCLVTHILTLSLTHPPASIWLQEHSTGDGGLVYSWAEHRVCTSVIGLWDA